MKIVPILEPPTESLRSGSPALPHILLVLDGLAGPLGGGERIALKLAALLPDYGYRVSILTFMAPTEANLRANPPCPIYLLPLTSAFSLSALKATLHFRRFLREQKVDIVQTFFESSDLWAGVVTRAMSSARLIWSRRDMGILRRRKHHLAYRFLAKMPDRVFAVSELVRRHCIEIDGIAPERVETIYNGLNLADWNAAPAGEGRDGRTVVTTVGNIRPVKGHDLFVRAAAKVIEHYPNTIFSIAGSTLDRAFFGELQELIRELDLTDHVHFAGGLKDLRRHFAGADIFVLPSRSEGFSNAIVEAMAMSLPVVATDVGGNAEAVADGISGCIVPPEDVDALANAILHLLKDPDRARDMGRVGREIVAERFTIDVMMHRLTQAYREVLAGAGSRRGLARRLPPPRAREKTASSS